MGPNKRQTAFRFLCRQYARLSSQAGRIHPPFPKSRPLNFRNAGGTCEYVPDSGVSLTEVFLYRHFGKRVTGTEDPRISANSPFTLAETVRPDGHVCSRDN